MREGVSVGAYVLAHGLSNDKVNGLTGNVVRMQGERVVVALPPPFGESALKQENIRVVPSKVGVWEKVVSNSTSPGDFYWYNWDSGDSVWELPDEIRDALLVGDLPDDAVSESDAASVASKKRSISEVSEEAMSEPSEEIPPPPDAEMGLTPSSTATTPSSANKLDELILLRNRLAQLESAKKRKVQQHQQQINAQRKEVDMQLAYLEPLDHGLRSLPPNTVPLAD